VASQGPAPSPSPSSTREPPIRAETANRSGFRSTIAKQGTRLEPATLSSGSVRSAACIKGFRSTIGKTTRLNSLGTAPAGWSLARDWHAAVTTSSVAKEGLAKTRRAALLSRSRGRHQRQHVQRGHLPRRPRL
jgi:hypothetical protein